MEKMSVQNRVQRFSFRKCSFGLASVLLGFWLVSGTSSVYGDEMKASDPTTVGVETTETLIEPPMTSEIILDQSTSLVVENVEVPSVSTGLVEVKEVPTETVSLSKVDSSDLVTSVEVESKSVAVNVAQEMKDGDIAPFSETDSVGKLVSVKATENIKVSEPSEAVVKVKNVSEDKSESSILDSIPKAGDDESPQVKLVGDDEKPLDKAPIRRSQFRVADGGRNTYIGDNYPWKYGNINGDLDRWGYPVRQCTSFVAFRLAETNGFSNVGYLGNGGSWGINAASRGGYVDKVPAVGSVAWFGPGLFGGDPNYGHVAWVAAVEGDNVIIEEYNFNWSFGYKRRSISASSVSGYIHFKDLGDRVATPTVQKNAGELASSGTYHFTTKSFIKSEPRVTATDVAYYDVGMSVNYDRTLEADGHHWISYISSKGGRYYISVGKASSKTATVVTPVSTNPVATVSSSLPASGTYQVKEKSFIKAEPKLSAADLAYYDAESSVNYDKVLEADGYRWISYLSFQGNRRYIAIQPLEASNPSAANQSNVVASSKVSLPASGSYTFTQKSFIKNEPSLSAENIAYYDIGMSVNYDKIVSGDGRDWLSYISGSGVRRYIALP
ncbi:SH3 domain-containing protein [Streptococcus danieliae]|uniref:N-acetylmuramoyl-L-alanine amidase n=1 Tax=Streptococcus danieliae TaxID=747656 RepID=A0A7Z0LDX8_9STRE|nr:SH3 domain-containing protein [Streptococcus danieliae]MBF0717779.1 SH3 domain-containing protein [Streptococcus danieliae]NYS49709.1 SH3 domain-containing protein [Streptococcus danieliae]